MFRGQIAPDRSRSLQIAPPNRSTLWVPLFEIWPADRKAGPEQVGQAAPRQRPRLAARLQGRRRIATQRHAESNPDRAPVFGSAQPRRESPAASAARPTRRTTTTAETSETAPPAR
jgi:hypothetical protein